MNWVGGVRRRVLLKEEELRRQEQFFASHAASAKLRGLSNRSSKSGEKDQMLDISSSSRKRPVLGTSHLKVRNHEREDMICSKIRRGKSSCVNSKDLHSFVKHSSQEGNRSTDSEKKVSFLTSDLFKKFRIKPSSIHGPFSKYLLQLELEGVQKKLKDQKKDRLKHSRAKRTRTNKKGTKSKDTEQSKKDNDQQFKIDAGIDISDDKQNEAQGSNKDREENKGQAIKNITGPNKIEGRHNKEHDFPKKQKANEVRHVRGVSVAKVNQAIHSSRQVVHAFLEKNEVQEVRKKTVARLNEIKEVKHSIELFSHDFLERNNEQNGQNMMGSNKNETQPCHLQHKSVEKYKDQEVNIMWDKMNKVKQDNHQLKNLQKLKNLEVETEPKHGNVQCGDKFDGKKCVYNNNLTSMDRITNRSNGFFMDDEKPNKTGLSQSTGCSGNQRKEQRKVKAEASKKVVLDNKVNAKFNRTDLNRGNNTESKDDSGKYIQSGGSDYPQTYQYNSKCSPTKEIRREGCVNHKDVIENKKRNIVKFNQEEESSKSHKIVSSGPGSLETHPDENLGCRDMNENPLVLSIQEMFSNQSSACHTIPQNPWVDTPVSFGEKEISHPELLSGTNLDVFNSIHKPISANFSPKKFVPDEISFESSHAYSSTPVIEKNEQPHTREPFENKPCLFDDEGDSSPFDLIKDYYKTTNLWGSNSCTLEVDSHQHGNPLPVKPRLNNLSRNVIIMESSHNVAKLNDKTPYMEKTYMSPHFEVCTLSGGSSNKSSKTPSEVVM